MTRYHNYDDLLTALGQDIRAGNINSIDDIRIVRAEGGTGVYRPITKYFLAEEGINGDAEKMNVQDVISEIIFHNEVKNMNE